MRSQRGVDGVRPFVLAGRLVLLVLGVIGVILGPSSSFGLIRFIPYAAVGSLVVIRRPRFLAALGATLGTVVFAFAMILFELDDGTWMWSPAVMAYLMIPVSILVAIRRDRLYEIDRIVSRTVSYLLVTGVLATIFAGMVISMQGLLEGVTQGVTLAVAGSTLAAFALVQPVRRRIQSSVDGRFDRSRVDAEALLGAFVGHVRDQVDLGQLQSSVIAPSAGAVQPRSAAVWLRSAAGSRR